MSTCLNHDALLLNLKLSMLNAQLLEFGLIYAQPCLIAGIGLTYAQLLNLGTSVLNSSNWVQLNCSSLALVHAQWLDWAQSCSAAQFRLHAQWPNLRFRLIHTQLLESC